MAGKRGQEKVEKIYTEDYEPYFPTHERLFRSVTGAFVTNSRSPVTPLCRERLERAVKLIGRVDELSCGLWVVDHLAQWNAWGPPSKSLAVRVELKPRFLRSVGIEVPSVYYFAGASHTILPIELGCPECVRAFAVFAEWRWHGKIIGPDGKEA